MCTPELIINSVDVLTIIVVHYAGSPTVTGVTFDNADTLTCTSSGGPATEVKWRRNCVIVQPSDTNYVQSQNVTDTALATYDNTLKLTGTSNDGVYTCSVSNARGYGNGLTGVGGKKCVYT